MASQSAHRILRYQYVPDDAIPGVKAICACGHETTPYPRTVDAENVLISHVRRLNGARAAGSAHGEHLQRIQFEDRDRQI